MESFFYSLISAVCVPFILLIYFLFSILMVAIAPPGRVDVKGPARLIALLLSFTVFLLVAAVLHSYSAVTRTNILLIPVESVIFAMLGIGLGVVYCLAAYTLVRYNLVEVLVLVMTTFSLLWFYFYFVESGLREIVVVLAVGQLAGILSCALLFAQRLPQTGLVWVCNRCGTHHFFYTGICRVCGQTQRASQAVHAAVNQAGPGAGQMPPVGGNGGPLGGPGPQVARSTRRQG